MADTDDEDDADLALRLNSLERFVKRSPRLLLEEYSHCEVPAGCGGVVMRWVDPRVGTPAQLQIVLPTGRAEAWIDGVAVDSSRIDVAPGEHLLAIELSELDPSRAWVLIGLLRALGEDSMGADAVVLTGSRGDGRWLGRSDPPGPDWREPGEPGDSGWSPLADGSRLVAAETRDSWRHRTMRSAGLLPLDLGRLRGDQARAWVRHRFTVAPLDPSREEPRR